MTKWMYLPSGGKHASNNLKYTATREGVQPVSNDRYLRYMAHRPKSHGLFSYYGADIDLNKVAKEVENHKGVIWRPIFSLTPEDASRLGYDNADRWQELLNANAAYIADQMGIPQSDFRWYAAYHAEEKHPHVHMTIFSANPGREFLSDKGVENIRSKLAREIFKNELQQIYEQQTVARDDLYRKAEQKFKDILAAMCQGVYNNPKLDELLPKIEQALEQHKGRLVYGYLSKNTKKLVDAAVDVLAEDPTVAQAYAEWCALRREVLHTYRDDSEELPPLSAQPEFKKIRNMVVREVVQAMQNMTDDVEQADTVELALDEEAVEGSAWVDFKKPDPDTAVEVLNKAAVKGNLYAAYKLASLYLNADNDNYNPNEAIKLLEIAAAQHHSYAQYRLAKLLLAGEVVPKDIDRAIQLLERSAEQCNSYAQYLLGKLYLLGQEVEQDIPLAKEYLTESARQGNEYAQHLLEHQEQWQQARLLFCGTQLLRDIATLFAQEQPRPRGIKRAGIDRKRLRQLRQKKIALGHAEEDMDIKL